MLMPNQLAFQMFMLAAFVAPTAWQSFLAACVSVVWGLLWLTDEVRSV